MQSWERHVYRRTGDADCTLVVQPVTRAELIEVERLEESSRGAGGFGHTGH